MLTTGIVRTLAVLVCGLILLGAAVEPALGADISGSFETKLALAAEDPHELSGGSELYINLDQFLQRTALHVGMKVSRGFPQEEIFDFDVDEAYLDYYGDSFDLRVGKQRVSWGTAVELNPTNILNPVDLSEPLGDRRAVWMAKLDYYTGNGLQVTGVYIPFFEPAAEQIPGLPSVTVYKPEATFENSEYAMKASLLGVRGFDASISYFSGYEDLPVPVKSDGGPIQKAIYPEVQTIGVDFATAIDDFGLWVEGAYSKPSGLPEYHHWVVGSDYRFGSGLYTAAQYYHREDAQGESNYLFGGIEKDFLSIHYWKVGAIYDLDSDSYMVIPEVTISLAEATDLVLGMRYLEDSEGTLRLSGQQESQVYGQLVMSF